MRRTRRPPTGYSTGLREVGWPRACLVRSGAQPRQATRGAPIVAVESSLPSGFPNATYGAATGRALHGSAGRPVASNMSRRSEAQPVNRRAGGAPDRRAIPTPLARSGGLVHVLSTARVPHCRAERWAKGGPVRGRTRPRRRSARSEGEKSAGVAARRADGGGRAGPSAGTRSGNMGAGCTPIQVVHEGRHVALMNAGTTRFLSR